MKLLVHGIVVAACLWLYGGCSFLPLYSYANEPVSPAAEGRGMGESDTVPSGAEVASEAVPWDLDPACRNTLTITEQTQPPRLETRSRCARNDGQFVALAISGGGSRAAVLSSEVLFELERYGVLQQVDVMSSVSGGSYTAALYALSCDYPEKDPLCPATVEGTPRMRWEPDLVYSRLGVNFIGSWVGNWFWPDNFFRYWLTDYDRTDIMAETLADNLFDNSVLGNEGYRMQDLNPQRPNLLINATNNTFVDVNTNIARHRLARQTGGSDELNFTFTREQFSTLNSSLDRFPVSYAVAASSAFPGAFQYVTLGNFAGPKQRYVHLYDGGTSDNLGLVAIERVIANAAKPVPARKLVVLIDAYVPSIGKDENRAEPRGGMDYFVDTNALDAYDSILTSLRDQEVRNFQARQIRNDADFIWLTFERLQGSHLDLFRTVSQVKTDLRITDEDLICLRHAARLLVAGQIDAIRRGHPGLRVPAEPLKPAAPLPPCDTSPRVR